MLRICAVVSVPVQLGGGLREAGDVSAAFEAGAERVVLGTAALSDPALLEALVEEHGERIAVAADVRGDRVAIEGWERESAIGAAALIGDLVERGVRRFVYTPVDVDGTLAGPDTEGVGGRRSGGGSRCRADHSGGIGDLEHLRALADAQLPALSGVIVDGRSTSAGSPSPRAARRSAPPGRRGSPVCAR